MKRLLLAMVLFCGVRSVMAVRHKRGPLPAPAVYDLLQKKIRFGHLSQEFFNEHPLVGSQLDQPFAHGMYKGFTPLTLAVELHRPISVDLLLYNGADVNREDVFGSSPLGFALQRSWFEGFRSLLNAGGVLTDDICIEIPRRSVVMDYVLCYYPLSQRCLDTMLLGNEKYYNIVRLIDAGANVNYKNKFGATPIDNAVKLCDHRAIKILAKYGACLSDIQEESINYVLSESDCTRCCFSEKGERRCQRTKRVLMELGVIADDCCDNSCCKNIFPIPVPFTC